MIVKLKKLKSVLLGKKRKPKPKKKEKVLKFEQLKSWVSCKSIGGASGDGYSLGKDKDGFFVYTHKARSKSYPLEKDIPKSDKLFIGSTA
jgi:hypothetical protein